MHCMVRRGWFQVGRSRSDYTVADRSRSSCPCHHSQPLAARSPVAVVVDGLGRADADWRAGAAGAEDDDDTETLRRRLRDTVETCQRLAAALDARHGGSTTHDVGQTSSAPTRTCPLLAAVDTVGCVVLPFLGRIAYMMSWALSLRCRGLIVDRRYSRKLFIVSSATPVTLIRLRSDQTSTPTSTT